MNFAKKQAKLGLEQLIDLRGYPADALANMEAYPMS